MLQWKIPGNIKPVAYKLNWIMRRNTKVKSTMGKITFITLQWCSHIKCQLQVQRLKSAPIKYKFLPLSSGKLTFSSCNNSIYKAWQNKEGEKRKHDNKRMLCCHTFFDTQNWIKADECCISPVTEGYALTHTVNIDFSTNFLHILPFLGDVNCKVVSELANISFYIPA